MPFSTWRPLGDFLEPLEGLLGATMDRCVDWFDFRAFTVIPTYDKVREHVGGMAMQDQ